MCYGRKKAFTLTELLIVISVIALLMAILMPALAAARSRGRALACKSNLRQLLLAGIGYATENDDSYVPAASDMWDNAGLHRWHGLRETLDAPFDPLKGPLAGYLTDGRVKDCPAKADFLKGKDWSTNFEQGCGGYGYNMTYIGSRLWQNGVCSIEAWKASYSSTTRIAEVTAPGRTLMFADTAIAKDRRYLIEYSFAEPPFTVRNGLPVTDFYMSPSIHFRHNTQANIGWADGHVDRRRLTMCQGSNAYGIDSAGMKLGWFDPVDNSPYDLK
jgi:prepilin-type N-terminal cleavage/methylation domain-containing protein/prepilin-type processing-associated H-X9-DG protein